MAKPTREQVRQYIFIDELRDDPLIPPTEVEKVLELAEPTVIRAIIDKMAESLTADEFSTSPEEWARQGLMNDYMDGATHTFLKDIWTNVQVYLDEHPEELADA